MTAAKADQILAFRSFSSSFLGHLILLCAPIISNIPGSARNFTSKERHALAGGAAHISLKDYS